jgi:predicted PurR-regulated permease PerM
MPAAQSRDLARTTFQLLMLAALIGTSLWIMRPFLVALTWATMIAVSTWPLLLRAQAGLGGRRSLAVALMTTALLLVLVVPLYFAVTTVVENLAQLVRWSTTLATLTIPPMPSWVATLPVIGPKIAEGWQDLAASSPEDIAAQLAPFAQKVAFWFAAQVGNIGLLLLQFLLTVIIATILYSKGETAAAAVDRFARRLAGAQGESAVHIAAQAIRAVALGVVVTALVQSILGGIGLAVAGVPFAAVLTALMFILGVAQIGAAPVLILAAIWVYARTGAGWGTAFLVWAIFCATFDNLLRPVLIRRGADLPLLLIFVGVIGGLVAFGVIGLFIGPAVLAVAYALLVEWMSEADRE